MAVNIVGMDYDSQKKLPKHLKICSSADVSGSGKISTTLSPVPYILQFELAILSKSIDDNFQIIEQLVPYFAPSFTQEINLLNNYEPLSVQYTISGINPESRDEWQATDERLFLSTINFSANLNYYYSRVSTGIIKELIANFRVGNGTDYNLIKKFDLDAQNLTPTTTIENRALEPIDTTITEY